MLLSNAQDDIADKTPGKQKAVMQVVYSIGHVKQGLLYISFIDTPTRV